MHCHHPPVGTLVEALRRRLQLLATYFVRARLQWLWFLAGVPAERVGYGPGPLTWFRAAVDRQRHREFEICLLEVDSPLRFGPLTAWAINRSSKRCRAVLNGDVSRADVIWIYSQDPLSSSRQAELEQRIRELARQEAVVVNPPAAYNSYHSTDAFARLARAGVCVPRHTFTDADHGKVKVVYKTSGMQGAEKYVELYDGPRRGMVPFEFVNCMQSDGMYRRYRVHYLLGLVRPSEVFIAPHWNVCFNTAIHIEYSFSISDDEERQIRTIARVLELGYFAVDFLRSSDGTAVFTDINVYPTILSPHSQVRKRGDYGQWHTFDARRRMGIPEPKGKDVWESFDEAVAAVVEQRTVPKEVVTKVRAWNDAQTITEH